MLTGGNLIIILLGAEAFCGLVVFLNWLGWWMEAVRGKEGD